MSQVTHLRLAARTNLGACDIGVVIGNGSPTTANILKYKEFNLVVFDSLYILLCSLGMDRTPPTTFGPSITSTYRISRSLTTVILSLLRSTKFFSAEASYVLFLDNGSGNQCGFDIIQFMYIVASINLLN